MYDFSHKQVKTKGLASQFAYMGTSLIRNRTPPKTLP
jgi:hypothetical protein